MAGLFDSHTHLNNPDILADIDGVVERLREAGVEYVMNVGYDLESSLKAVEQAHEYEWCYAAVGCHPHDAKTMDEETLEKFRELSADPKVKAIGEIGLDYYYDLSPRETQREWFRRQIRLAKEVGLPIIIHDRDAHEECMTILKEEDAFPNGVLMHCYSGSAEMAKELVKLGAMLSIPGTITFKNNRKQKEVVKSVPLEHLMVETDAPYLTPVPFRGHRNEPAYVRYTAMMVAEVLQMDRQEVIDATNANARRYFGI